eukprot:1061087-Prymnesium_polylepis.1
MRGLLGSRRVPSTSCSATARYDLWPMMRRVAVADATRALRCPGWHEIRARSLYQHAGRHGAPSGQAGTYPLPGQRCAVR